MGIWPAALGGSQRLRPGSTETGTHFTDFDEFANAECLDEQTEELTNLQPSEAFC